MSRAEVLASPAADQHYVLLPTPLALDLRNSPLAVGLYLLIARSYLVHQAPIPLSASDVQAYDAGAQLSRGAVTRALDRLAGGGWLIATARPGHKSAYLPAWGHRGDAAAPWAIGRPALDRPSRVKTVRVPSALLDICLGRLTPHAQHPAIVTRYLTRPALALADIGAYALALVGAGAPTLALARLDLADAGGVLTPPAPDALLARASQLSLHDRSPDAPALSSHGLRRAGLHPAPPPPADQPLFFVPPGVIGGMSAPLIGGVIAGGDAATTPDPAPAPPPAAGEAGVRRAHGVIDSQGDDRSTPLPPANHRASAGGGGASPTLSHRRGGRCVQERGGRERTPPNDPHAEPAGAAARAEPETEAARQLLAIGVRQDIAHQLAGRPLPQVARAILQARARPGVRDIAGWVVSALRALPEAEPQPTAPPPKVSDLAILTHPGLTHHERTRWLTRFRSADLADRPALLARFHAEHPAAPKADAAELAVPPGPAAPPS